MSDDMGAGIAKTFGKYILRGALVLGGLAGLIVAVVKTTQAKKDPTYSYQDGLQVSPLHSRVYDLTSGLTADFNTGTVYNVRVVGKDTIHVSGLPFNDVSVSPFAVSAAEALKKGRADYNKSHRKSLNAQGIKFNF